MQRNNPIRLRLLSFAVIAYMCLAFSWWSILLYTKNQDAFRAKVDTLRLVMVAEGTFGNEERFKDSEPFTSLQEQYERQEWMIFGEAALFMLSIIVGVWIINNSYNNLIKTAQEKRNFLLSITHELKSPIASARLGLETIQRRKLPEEQVERIAINAQHELDRLKTLVDNLLLAAKVENNYTPLFERENVHDLIRDYVNRMAMAYPDVEFSLDLEENSRFADLDRTGFMSMIGNLIDNAIKYSPEEKLIQIHSKSDGKTLSISVSDQGVGIPEEEKKNIFNSFYRVGSEDTRKTKGTGLGLYILEQLVDAHKGSIMVTDNRPKGTTFTLHLPCTQN